MVTSLKVGGAVTGVTVEIRAPPHTHTLKPFKLTPHYQWETLPTPKPDRAAASPVSARPR